MAENLRLDTLIKSLEDNQASDIQVIDVKEQTSVTDYMVICTSRSSRHLRAVADHLMKDMKSIDFPAIGKHGINDGDWALIDFGEFVVHIMLAESRAFYNIEGLWQDSTQLSKRHA